MKREQAVAYSHVVGGVDTHKDLHVAAIVDEHDLVLGSECFPSTRHGYKQMLIWMRSFGEVSRVGVVHWNLWRRSVALPAAGRSQGAGSNHPR